MTHRGACLRRLLVHERYPYRFTDQQVTTERGPVRCSDDGLVVDDTLVASVERDNRKLAQERTFRFLGAAAAWWRTEQDVVRGLGGDG